MKKILCIALLLGVFSGPSLAQGMSQTEQHEFCSSMSELARSIMGARQRGVSMKDVMEVARSSDIPEFNDFQETMVIGAYDGPQYSSEEYQQKAVRSFENEIHLACVKSFRDR